MDVKIGGGHLISYSNSKIRGFIPYKAVEEKINVNHNDFEYICAKVIDDNIVSFCITWASGQAGIIGIWDINSKSLIHLSEGAYAINTKIIDNKLYSLCDVSYWGCKQHYELYSIQIGVINPSLESEIIDKDLQFDNNTKIAKYKDKILDFN